MHVSERFKLSYRMKKTLSYIIVCKQSSFHLFAVLFLFSIRKLSCYTSTASFFSCRSLSASKTLPPFVATFEPTFDLSFCGLPDTGPIYGDESITKKEAEENCSAKVLKLFREKEKDMLSTSHGSSNRKAALEEGEEGEISEEEVEDELTLGKRSQSKADIGNDSSATEITEKKCKPSGGDVSDSGDREQDCESKVSHCDWYMEHRAWQLFNF